MGAVCASRGLRTAVTFGSEIPPGPFDALVINTDTRNESAPRARTAVSLAAADLKRLGVADVFKKVDSTLRGPIAAELQAMHEAWPGRIVLFTPAYPQLGRTVSRGQLYAHGVDISNSDFARDPRSPVRDSRITSVLPSGYETWLRVCDASTEEDLKHLVADYGSTIMYAGSGGLGRAWVERLPSVQGEPAPTLARPKRLLLISGSHHPASIAQAENAKRAGHTVLAAPGAMGDARQIQESLVSSALEQISLGRPDLIVIFGGETATNLLRATGTTHLLAVRELLPGIAVSSGRVCNEETLIVTKAGGFASPDVVDEILDKINR